MTQVNITEDLLYSRHDIDLPLYYYKGEQVSRKQMMQAVSELASHLSRYIEPGDNVIIYMNDSPSLVSAFLASIACGAIPSVVNPKMKSSGLQYLLDLTNARLVFTSLSKATYIPHSCDFEVIYAEDDESVAISDFSLGKGNPEWREFVRKNGSSTAYLQFTSGSTGHPKAVKHSAAATLSFCHGVSSSWLGLGPLDVLYSVPKMFFGYGMGNSLFFPLFSGASAILDCDWPAPDGIMSNLLAYRPTVLFAGPAIFSMLRPRIKEVSRVINKAVSAGSVLSEDEASRWAGVGVHIKNGFGATELGHIFLASHDEEQRGSNLTKLLDGYDYRLLDKQGLEISGCNQAGVLLVRGPSLSDGYVKQDAVTAEKFIDGWYRTGDLFEIDEAGAFRYLGREDDLFKVNGRWVVPSVIETSVCEAFPNVAEAVLVPSSLEKDTLRGTLFVVSTGNSVNEAEIKRFIRAEHESYMAPDDVVSLDAIPRNANGKLFRRSLIDLAQSRLAEMTEAVPCT